MLTKIVLFFFKNVAGKFSTCWFLLFVVFLFCCVCFKSTGLILFGGISSSLTMSNLCMWYTNMTQDISPRYIGLKIKWDHFHRSFSDPHPNSPYLTTRKLTLGQLSTECLTVHICFLWYHFTGSSVPCAFCR